MAGNELQAGRSWCRFKIERGRFYESEFSGIRLRIPGFLQPISSAFGTRKKNLEVHLAVADGNAFYRFLATQIRADHFRDADGAIPLLISLPKSDLNARERQARSV